ncbi:OmpA family protein [Pedobacter sandarakinus]|uniref:OmpA family protein n=1 Tax=Pedobacter sandarakinus TaxID=353156 RepID=UPI0022456D86|nr:OmpA family protein [Pedobacter sandarakinus]MCX2576149.1 OmpA family protein [Pedobacter sandarakinus]
MMKKSVSITVIVVFILMFAHIKVSAQYVLKEADLQYELYNYSKAVVLYTEAYQKKKTLRTVERLADSYRLMRDFKQAESWYAILVAMDGATPEAYKWYAEMLMNNAKYSEAKEQFTKYAAASKNLTNPQTEQIKFWQNSCDSALKWMRKPNRVILTNEKNLNSAQSDWSAIPYQDGILFSSDRTISGMGKAGSGKRFLKFDGSNLPEKNVYGWTGNRYLRIYQKSNDSDSIAVFPIKDASEYHIAAPSFSADGNEVFFTLTKIPEKIEKVKGSPVTLNIAIYSSKKQGNAWSEPISFRYNNIQKWSVGDPFLSQDGKILYFVSDMPGGKGGTDIYFCKRTEDNQWTEAVNLSAVNTNGNERSPMVHNNFLYFSTDGNITMGGLDIYKAKMDGSNIGKTENMGYPINSPQDDFAYQPKGKAKGYLASNRDGGLGSDDIYSFIEQQQLIFKLEGTVFNKETKLPLVNAIVGLKKVDGVPLKIQTDDKGRYQFDLSESTDYDMTADKTNFRNATDQLTTKNLDVSKVIRKDFYLDSIIIAKPIRLENIYYDFDKFNIRPDAAKELDKLVKILKENPTIWIELGSHTDSRGNDDYNQKLSQNRANSAVRYIVSRGIDKSRITAKGYGESMLLNRCENGVKCSKEEHQLNRRTEFKIVKQ